MSGQVQAQKKKINEKSVRKSNVFPDTGRGVQNQKFAFYPYVEHAWRIRPCIEHSPA